MEDGSPLRLADGSHVVQFYEDEQDLVGLVGAYLAASLLDGDRVVAIGTRAHTDRFQAELEAAGLDLTGAVTEGRLVLLDADETLARFMVSGRPSPDRFDATVGACIRSLAAAGQPVRAYGEMVARLWQQGHLEAAVELEGLWNQLAERTAFGLFCAYPLELMSDTRACEAFGEVCDLHSHVLDGAPEPEAESVRRFVASPNAARSARRYVAATLAQWGYGAIEDDAMIAVGELVANAVRHGGSQFVVGMARTPGGLRVMVSDSSPAAPKPGAPTSLDLGGRGLHMVETVTSGWGYRLDGTGKVVWADLALPETASQAS